MKEIQAHKSLFQKVGPRGGTVYHRSCRNMIYWDSVLGTFTCRKCNQHWTPLSINSTPVYVAKEFYSFSLVPSSEPKLMWATCGGKRITVVVDGENAISPQYTNLKPYKEG